MITIFLRSSDFSGLLIGLKVEVAFNIPTNIAASSVFNFIGDMLKYLFAATLMP